MKPGRPGGARPGRTGSTQASATQGTAPTPGRDAPGYRAQGDSGTGAVGCPRASEPPKLAVPPLPRPCPGLWPRYNLGLDKGGTITPWHLCPASAGNVASHLCVTNLPPSRSRRGHPARKSNPRTAQHGTQLAQSIGTFIGHSRPAGYGTKTPRPSAGGLRGGCGAPRGGHGPWGAGGVLRRAARSGVWRGGGRT